MSFSSVFSQSSVTLFLRCSHSVAPWDLQYSKEFHDHKKLNPTVNIIYKLTSTPHFSCTWQHFFLNWFSPIAIKWAMKLLYSYKIMKKRFPNLWSSNNQSVFSLKTYIVMIDKMKQLVLLKRQPMKSISMHYEHHTLRSCNLASLYWTVPFKKKNFIIFIHIILIS